MEMILLDYDGNILRILNLFSTRGFTGNYNTLEPGGFFL